MTIVTLMTDIDPHSPVHMEYKTDSHINVPAIKDEPCTCYEIGDYAAVKEETGHEEIKEELLLDDGVKLEEPCVNNRICQDDQDNKNVLYKGL